ncbi:hypothetical protein MVEN_01773600 [Mycena venus]|uniref:Uncharacterized protein n=1 Tax=Mycena venus TaxID=2733690 RepID=A0A8H6XLU7_9AGAR|nr:hypothetical protein MVEN_01773600 [Mycena venus]
MFNARWRPSEGLLSPASWRWHVPAIGRADSTNATCGCSYMYAVIVASLTATKLINSKYTALHAIGHFNKVAQAPAAVQNPLLDPSPLKRNFFGLGEIVGVLTNPAETVRSLTESKRLLDEARREINENKERAQLRVKHTFSRYPGFFPRRAEAHILEQVLEGEPSFTVLFGASSVGKTALLREVLCSDAYHVLHFDLRIAGFADLASLYTSLSQQMEQYFEEIGKLPGYEEFEREGWGFKHDRLNVERRMAETPPGSPVQNVRTSDVARLMELFQYREFEPVKEEGRKSKTSHPPPSNNTETSRRHRLFFRRDKGKNKAAPEPAQPQEEKAPTTAPKKIPVIFFDEAHRLPALIQSTETMKCLARLDVGADETRPVLNVMQHCKILTIGDCSKAETRAFFIERIIPRVPRRLRPRLNFEQLYDAFGGKLAHWHDYCTDYINSNGTLEIKQSSHFLQAHALLNLHLIHSSQAATSEAEGSKGQVVNNRDAIHPGLGPAGFKIYSPITNPRGPSPYDNRSSAGYDSADFSAMELLKVMGRLGQPDVQFLPYFPLCREIGVRAVDGMVKGRVLDLRWTEPGVGSCGGRGSSGTAVDQDAVSATISDGESDMVPVSERELLAREAQDLYVEVVGCKLVPTPIMKFAMREVIEEYEDQRSVSDYVSLSEVEEY